MIEPHLPTVDRYELVGTLGRGGMATVYLARHKELRSLHAVKVLLNASSHVASRLIQEGRAQSALRHPNIVAVTDLVEVDGAPGLVVEYVDGPALDALLAARKLEPDEADALARGILDGVIAAHRAGLVHRDLKPGNVLVAIHHDRLVPKVADFGLVKVLGADASQGRHTRTGAMLGTPSYMAPEQIRDAASVDARADVFALGCILFELVTGRLAFEGRDSFDVQERIVHGRYIDPRDLAPDLPEHRAAAILGALEPDRDARIPSVEALAARWTRGEPAGSVDWTPAIEAARGVVGERATTGSIEASGETWYAQSRAEPPPTVPEAAPTQRRPWWIGLVALGVVGALAVAWNLAPPGSVEPAPHVLSTEALVQVTEDPALQAQFAAGWRAYLDADLRTAINRMEVVVASDPADPLPWMVLTQARFHRGDRASAVQSAWTGFEKMKTFPSPLSDISPTLLKANFGGAWAGEVRDAYFAHLERYPTDAFVRLVGLEMAETMTEPEATEVYDEARRSLEAVPLVYLLRAQDRAARGLWSEAVEAARLGKQKNPASPAIAGTLGRVLLEQGDFDAALPELKQAMTLDPSDAAVRADLAVAYLYWDEDDNARASHAAIFAEGTPLRDQVSYGLRVAEALAGLGRLDEADALLASVGRRAEAAGDWPIVIEVDRTRIDLLCADQRWEAARAILAHTHQAMAAPELASELRQRFSTILLQFEGAIAAVTGDLEQARAIRDRLQRVDKGYEGDMSYLDLEIAIAEGRVDAIEAATWTDSCLDRLRHGLSLARAGGPNAAEVLDGAIADPSRCSAVGEARTALVAARIALADLEPERAREHLAAARELQPDADPTSHLARRLAE